MMTYYILIIKCSSQEVEKINTLTLYYYTSTVTMSYIEKKKPENAVKVNSLAVVMTNVVGINITA
ncbi:hypothetical protein THIOM_000411 [Candidatus Thiomargarita nelsonii]|uniref:Uncharacterized protein n=1 Tax=Candidatus Thiomargarita nelsonii TaxID=1003181 RepID=A0A176S7C7_9GAMM|nr:hypothetical protein THIOM_000411 [Candidatus Thiomargarita nelsonii]